MSFLSVQIANGTFTTEQIQQYVQSQEVRIDRAERNEDHFKNLYDEQAVKSAGMSKKLKMATFLAHLHTHKEFKRFAECCGEHVTPANSHNLTDDMIAYPDNYVGFIDVYKKNKLEEEKKKALARVAANHRNKRGRDEDCGGAAPSCGTEAVQLE